MVTAILGLCLLAFAPIDSPPTLFPSIVAVGAADLAVAPMPREKACPHRGSPDCLCADGDLRCRARAALSLAAASKTVPVAMPSKERIAAQNALKAAETKIKDAKP
jgi:hypothetical protein